MKVDLLLKCAVMIAAGSVLTVSAFAQRVKTISVDRDGEFHISSPIEVGGKTLKSGMYRLYPVFVNGEHFVAVRKILMNRAGKSMSPLKPGSEDARSRCTIEPTGIENRKTRILIEKNSVQGRRAVAVWFRGETVKHVLSQ